MIVLSSFPCPRTKPTGGLLGGEYDLAVIRRKHDRIFYQVAYRDQLNSTVEPLVTGVVAADDQALFELALALSASRTCVAQTFRANFRRHWLPHFASLEASLRLQSFSE